MADLEYPEGLRYTKEHEWLRVEGDVVHVGITSYAQDALGDIVFVTLPEPGAEVAAGEACGEVESTKSVSEIFAPVAGTVVETNDLLDNAPEKVNTDPYGDGWMFSIRPADPGVVESLMSASEYAAQLS